MKTKNFWHDLKINPEDLPEKLKNNRSRLVLICYMNGAEYGYSLSAYDYGTYSWLVIKHGEIQKGLKKLNVIAWKETPPVQIF